MKPLRWEPARETALVNSKVAPSKTPPTSRRQAGRSATFTVCIQNGEYQVDLIVGKIYRVVRPERNDGPADIRIFDESGEDYLYPRDWFVPIELPLKARKALVTS